MGRGRFRFLIVGKGEIKNFYRREEGDSDLLSLGRGRLRFLNVGKREIQVFGRREEGDSDF